jgi:hypothetical protein
MLVVLAVAALAALGVCCLLLAKLVVKAARRSRQATAYPTERPRARISREPLSPASSGECSPRKQVLGWGLAIFLASAFFPPYAYGEGVRYGCLFTSEGTISASRICYQWFVLGVSIAALYTLVGDSKDGKATGHVALRRQTEIQERAGNGKD